jgi:hypothetical protein
LIAVVVFPTPPFSETNPIRRMGFLPSLELSIDRWHPRP